MLKIHSNESQIKTHFLPYLKHLLQYSTTAQKIPSTMVDFLVKSLGFTPQEAHQTCIKLRSSNYKFSPQNPNLVIDFFKQRGFNKPQIKKVIYLTPQLLNWSIDKTLIPKFDALYELGIFGDDLADIVSSNASIIKRGMNTKIVPMISFIKSLVDNNDMFLTVLRRSYWLMSGDVSKRIKPNIELLRNYGLSNERILTLLQYNVEVFGHNPRKLEEFLVKVVKEFEIRVESTSFCGAVVFLASLSEESRLSKYGVFKEFGWTDFDILTMLRKAPRSLILSETNIRERLEFFQNVIGCKPSYLADRSYVLTYSMEDRVLPRYALLKGLKEKKVISNKVGILTAVCSSEPLFLKKFVLPYKDKHSVLFEAYLSRERKICGRPMKC